jgi:glycosyltransferase involved in cell wall biosynthesis
MNTVSIVGSVSRRAGGLFESVRRLHQALLGHNLKNENFRPKAPAPKLGKGSEARPDPHVSVKVLSLSDQFTETDLDVWDPVPVHPFKITGPRAFGYAPGLSRELRSLKPQLLHVHGLWQFTSLAALSWRRQSGRPLLISPHGMLDAWALRNSRLKKLIGWLAYERSHLKSATCIRALCQAEANSIRTLGLTNPICVIPNGVDLPNWPLQKPKTENRKIEKHDEVLAANFNFLAASLPKRKVLLYLGRIHPKKGLANLLRAWGRTPQRKEWVLVIAGWDQGGHQAELKSLATNLRIHWADAGSSPESGISVFFVGPQFGAAKHQWFQRCDAVILPSFSEGLPMGVLEAWAHAKPILMTPQCNLPEGFLAGAAFSILPQPDAIVVGLDRLFRTDHQVLEAMGSRGLAIVSARFAWPKIAAELKSVYYWMAGIAPKPECVLIS